MYVCTYICMYVYVSVYMYVPSDGSTAALLEEVFALAGKSSLRGSVMTLTAVRKKSMTVEKRLETLSGRGSPSGPRFSLSLGCVRGGGAVVGSNRCVVVFMIIECECMN